MKVLALALDDRILALADKVLSVFVLGTSGLGRGIGRSLGFGLVKAKTFPRDPGHLVAVRVCSAHTHSVT